MVSAPADSLERDIHVWHMELAAPDCVLARAADVLSPAETERAGRFVHRRLRDAFVLARAGLRGVLARYVGVAPERIELALGAAGKPSLSDPASDVQFNVSHAGSIAAYAVTRHVSLGVDIERIRPLPDYAALAAYAFSRAECADLARLPEHQREAGFFDCWVRKEAFVKAVGLGLLLPLDSFRVTLLPGEAPAVHAPPTGPGAAAAWYLHAYRPAPGYTGAVAWHDHTRALRVLPVLPAAEILSPGGRP
nr:hypothetical protein [uncultured bacterium]